MTRRSLNTVAENTAPDSLFQSRRESGNREDAFGPFDQDTKPEQRAAEGKPRAQMVSTMRINKDVSALERLQQKLGGACDHGGGSNQKTLAGDKIPH